MKAEPIGTEIPRNVWALTATSFLTDVSSDMIFHLLPLFLRNVLAVHTGFIGLIEGVGESAASLLKIVSGWLADRSRSRKPLTVAGYSLSTAAKAALALAGSWPAFLLLRFLERAGKGLRTAPRDALVAAEGDRSSQGRVFGLHRAGDTAGAVVGILLAYLLVRRLQAGGLELTAATFRTLVLVGLVPAMLAVLVLAVAVRESRAESTSSTPSLWSAADHGRQFYWFLTAVAVFSLGNSADAFLILRAQNVGMSVDRVLLVLLLFNALYAVIASPAGRLSDRWGRVPILFVGWLAYAGIYLGFALAGRAWHVFALMAAYGMYYGLTEGTARALVADLSPEPLRGTAFGAYHTVVGAMALPASLLAGVLWQGIGRWRGWGPAAPFVAGAILALLAVLILAMAGQRTGGWWDSPRRGTVEVQ